MSRLFIMWPKYWSFSFNISPSNEYLGLFCFRIDWFDLLAVQGTLKSLLQHHGSKASILWCFRVPRVSNMVPCPWAGRRPVVQANIMRSLHCIRQTVLAILFLGLSEHKMMVLLYIWEQKMRAYFPKWKDISSNTGHKGC